MVARDRSYSDLRKDLEGKRVLIWTCNTCARLCNGIGGTESAERLAEALRSDGIDVVEVLHTSASCIEKKVKQAVDGEILAKTDIVLSMTCNIGALCAKRMFVKDVLNPLVTIGAGFVGEDRTIYVCDDADGELSTKELSEASSELGLWSDPYV